MVSCLFLFAIGVVVLLVSTEYLLKLSSRLWAALRISPLIIGCTVVTIGTSLPELAVSTTAALRGDFGLAIGNILGSNIVNIFLVFALGIILGHVDIGINKTQKNGLLMAMVTILYLGLNFVVASPRVLGAILICLAGFFLLSEILLGEYGRGHEDRAFMLKKHDRFTLALTGKIFCALVGVFFGGLAVVYSIEKISLFSGYSTTFLGLSITAVATSLPELLTVVFSRKKDQKKVALGDILGSNIYNLLFIGGAVHLLSGQKIVFRSDSYFLIFSAVCGAVLVFIYAGKKVPKMLGFILLFFFFVYILKLL